MFDLVQPRLEHLTSYKAALQTGWSPDNLRPEAAQEQLAKIAQDAAKFIAEMDDREAKAGPVILPDGSQVQRLPGFRWWMWDGEFCGSIGFRWQKGTAELPSHVLGHIGYATVPWKRNLGYTKRAVALLIEQIRPLGLPYVDITTDLDNVASQKVALANKAVLVERFTAPESHGGRETLRFRIYLAANNS